MLITTKIWRPALVNFFFRNCTECLVLSAYSQNEMTDLRHMRLNVQRSYSESVLVSGQWVGLIIIIVVIVDVMMTWHWHRCDVICDVRGCTDVSVEDSGNYTCEVFGRRSVVLAAVTHTVVVRGTLSCMQRRNNTVFRKKWYICFWT